MLIHAQVFTIRAKIWAHLGPALTIPLYKFVVIKAFLSLKFKAALNTVLQHFMLTIVFTVF